MESKLYPVAGRHAVQSAAFVINFSTNLEVEKVSEESVSAMRDALKDRLPNFEGVKTFTFQVGAVPPNPSAGPQPAGWQLAKVGDNVALNGNPFKRVLGIQSAQFSVVENDYDRWAGFRDLLMACITASKDVAFQDGRPVRDIALAYQDVFVWRDDPKAAGAEVLFRDDSPYLPRNVFEVGSAYFHNSHGFISVDSVVDGATLVENVNVARSPNPENGGFDHFIINTEHRLSFNTPLYGFEAARSVIEPVIEELHTRNKRKLNELLVDGVQKMIKLGV